MKKQNKNNSASRHKTVPVAIKTVEIDVAMVSTIQWLNSFTSVNTLWCCEGCGSAENSTYVMFSCWDNYDLQKICQAVKSFYPGGGYLYGKIEVENFNGYFRYDLRFRTKKLFEEWKIKMKF